MKKFILLLLAATFVSGGMQVFAQGKYGADSAECIKYLSFYKELFKQKNYEEALPMWRKAYKYCPPTANQTMLVDGTALYRFLIAKNRNNPVVREGLVDTLLAIHDTRAEYYPKYAVTTLNNKGLDMISYIQENPKALFEGCKAIIEYNKTETKPQLFLFAINSAVALYQNGNLTAEDVIKVYEEVNEYIDKIIENTEADKREAINKVKADIENIFISSKVASCESLIELFTPRYEAEPENADLVRNIVKMLSMSEDCIDNDLFYNAVNSLYKIDPSYSSAYFLFKLNSSKDNVDEAISFLEKAIAYEESDAAQDAEYYYTLAVYCSKNGRASKAFDSALKAAELDSSYAAKAYMLCGQIWGSQSCPGNEVTKRAQYWVAVDYLNKAKAADSSFAEEADGLIRQYSAYFPQAAEAFMYDITAGQSYTVSCGGMRATTTVRTQK